MRVASSKAERCSALWEKCSLQATVPNDPIVDSNLKQYFELRLSSLCFYHLLQGRGELVVSSGETRGTRGKPGHWHHSHMFPGRQ